MLLEFDEDETRGGEGKCENRPDDVNVCDDVHDVFTIDRYVQFVRCCGVLAGLRHVCQILTVMEKLWTLRRYRNQGNS